MQDTIVPAMMAANPGRPISPDRVLSFADGAATSAWLTANPERVLGGVHFSDSGRAPGVLDYLLQVWWDGGRGAGG